MYPVSHLPSTLCPALSLVPPSMPQLRLLTEPLIYLGSKAPTPSTVPNKLQPSSQCLNVHPR